MLDAFKIDPGKMEKAETAARKPGWKAPWEVEVARSREDGIKADKADRTGLKVYSDGSDVDGGVGAGAVLYRGGREVKRVGYYLGKSEEHTVYEAELVGMIMGLEMIQREERVWRASLCLDNQAAIQATAKGSTEDAAQSIVLEVEHAYNQLKSKHGEAKIKICWVPGHEGVVGNEASDERAKEAARGGGSPPDDLPHFLRSTLPLSSTAAKAAYK